MKYSTILKEADPLGYAVYSCRVNYSRKKTLLGYTRVSSMESALSPRMRGRRAYFVVSELQYVLAGESFDVLAENDLVHLPNDSQRLSTWILRAASQGSYHSGISRCQCPVIRNQYILWSGFWYSRCCGRFSFLLGQDPATVVFPLLACWDTASV